MDHEHLGGGEKGVITLPEDSVEAWEVLLHWIITKTLPEDHECFKSMLPQETLQLELVQCWSLGDKYDVVAFQDLIMIELLSLLGTILIDEEAAQEAFERSPPGS